MMNGGLWMMARFDSLSKVFLLRPYGFKGDYIYTQRSMTVNWMPRLATIHAFSASFLLEQLIVKILLF